MNPFNMPSTRSEIVISKARCAPPSALIEWPSFLVPVRWCPRLGLLSGTKGKVSPKKNLRVFFWDIGYIDSQLRAGKSAQFVEVRGPSIGHNRVVG